MRAREMRIFQDYGTGAMIDFAIDSYDLKYVERATIESILQFVFDCANNGLKYNFVLDAEASDIIVICSSIKLNIKLARQLFKLWDTK